MRKFSITMVSLVAMTGFALGQAKTGSGTGSAAPKAAGSAAGAPKAAGSGAGSAAPKAGSGAGSGSAAAAPKMEAPKPPPEIAATMKQMGPHMNCTGIGMGGPDMKTEMKFKGTGTHAVALDGWWIHGTMTGTMGEGKTKMTMKMESWMTYDPKLSKWRTVGVMNDGASMVGTTDMTGPKWESASDTYGGMMGNGKFREHGDASDAKAGVKMWGEASMDGGKTWVKVFEMTCKK